MRAWFRLVLPGEGIGVAFLCVYAACYLPEIIYHFYGGDGLLLDAVPTSSVQSLHSIVILCFAGAYAGLRVFGFHPAFSKDHYEWLKQTPWQWGLPLPYGPVHLVPQDLAVLGILSAFGWGHLGDLWWIVPCVFLGTYSLAMLIAFLRTGLNRHAYLIAFGLGGVAWLFHDPLRLKLLLLAIYGVSFHGLRYSLKRFDEWDWPQFDQRVSFGSKAQRPQKLGWPFDSLGPHRHPFPVSLGWSAALALLAGWWVLGLAANVDDPGFREGLGLIVFFCGMALPIGRLFQYLWGYTPPISLWGRIATGEWIIPGYDKIFGAPLLGLAIMLWLTMSFRLPTEISLALGAAAPVFVAFGCPPSLDEWRLTGNHRILPAVNHTEMQQIP